jgi:hypothetical protein
MLRRYAECCGALNVIVWSVFEEEKSFMSLQGILKEGSITAPLASCLTGLESAV